MCVFVAWVVLVRVALCLEDRDVCKLEDIFGVAVWDLELVEDDV